MGRQDIYKHTPHTHTHTYTRTLVSISLSTCSCGQTRLGVGLATPNALTELKSDHPLPQTAWDGNSNNNSNGNEWRLRQIHTHTHRYTTMFVCELNYIRKSEEANNFNWVNNLNGFSDLITSFFFASIEPVELLLLLSFSSTLSFIKFLAQSFIICT